MPHVTSLAVAAALHCPIPAHQPHKTGYQALLLAPTELLASQHLATLNFIAERLPLSVRPRIELLTGSLANKEKAGVKARLAAGEVDLLVATQVCLCLGIHNMYMLCKVTDYIYTLFSTTV